jgi:hypothetical protein
MNNLVSVQLPLSLQYFLFTLIARDVGRPFSSFLKKIKVHVRIEHLVIGKNHSS